ncbi:MAG: hypothetical protein COB51_01040 [Moraxellaceae bacterium]|nr:MAG: hypothetical protein COB51_01040 [Moraxellaceae bacterium]
MALPRLIKPSKKIHKPSVDIESNLTGWFQKPVGRAIIDVETEILKHVLPYHFGYHLLYSGLCNPKKIMADSPIRHQFAVTRKINHHIDIPQLVCSPSELPIESDSVDVALLHHTMDYERHPHRLLREMSRVLIPGGSLIIVGFNPWSLWGGWKSVAKLGGNPLWGARFISPYRMNDWLSLLEFDVSGCESGYYLPPMNSLAGRARWSWFQSLSKILWNQGGATYILVAKKSVSCLTPIKPKWNNSRRQLVALPVANRDNFPNKENP